MRDSLEIQPLATQLAEILQALVDAEEAQRPLIEQVQPHYRDSARNLIHYLALRTFDLREIQWQLSSLGLSSIGHSERYTLSNVRNILHLLRLLEGEQAAGPGAGDVPYNINLPRGRRQLDANTLRLFGEEHFPGHTRIMVTLPSEAADDYSLVVNLLTAGMTVARINCAHDGPDSWSRMIAHLERACEETGEACRLYMDLAGPKLRTGTLPPRVGRGGAEKRGAIGVRVGDTVELVADPAGGVPPVFDDQGGLLQPGRIPVSLPGIFANVSTGDAIWFDDGKVGGRIEDRGEQRLVVRITATDPGGGRLRAEKGINLPDSRLDLPALTREDVESLELVVRHADMVGYSFVRRPADVELLQQELRRLGREEIGIILKIETRETFENLPALLLTAMRSPCVGTMIARGDLAVELGFLRIAEVQEEILWLCEAAHVPVIWATQILESLVRNGRATRAEISDAVLSVRAECAMLNKGPHIIDAVRMLKDIDRRMAPHQLKKKSSLRPLNVARLFFDAR